MAPYKSYKSLEERTRVLRQMDLLGTSDLRQVSKELNVSISSLSRFLKERKRVASLAKYKRSKKTSKVVEKKLRVANSQGEDLCVRKSVRFDCDVKEEAPDGAPLKEEVSVKKPDDVEEKAPLVSGKRTPDEAKDETSTPKPEKSSAAPRQDHAPFITWRALSEAKERQDTSKYPYAVEPTKREITAALSVLRRATETDLRMPLWCEFVSGRLQERIPRPSVVGGPWGWEVAEAVGTINDALRSNSGSAMWLRFALKNLF